MADYKVTDTELISIANAIRTKGGTQAQLEFPTGFVSAVQAIPTGGGGNINDVVNILNGGHGIQHDSLVPYYTSSTNPTGYVLSYSGQSGTTPAWALFNSILGPLTIGSQSNARWTSSGEAPQWVQIELPTAQKMNSFYISTIRDGNTFCKEYKIQGSNDGTAFTDIYSETLENSDIAKYVALPAETIAYKYYRISVFDTYRSPYLGLCSFFPMYINV